MFLSFYGTNRFNIWPGVNRTVMVLWWVNSTYDNMPVTKAFSNRGHLLGGYNSYAQAYDLISIFSVGAILFTCRGPRCNLHRSQQVVEAGPVMKYVWLQRSKWLYAQLQTLHDRADRRLAENHSGRPTVGNSGSVVGCSSSWEGQRQHLLTAQPGTSQFPPHWRQALIVLLPWGHLAAKLSKASTWLPKLTLSVEAI